MGRVWTLDSLRLGTVSPGLTISGDPVRLFSQFSLSCVCSWVETGTVTTEPYPEQSLRQPSYAISLNTSDLMAGRWLPRGLMPAYSRVPEGFP